MALSLRLPCLLNIARAHIQGPHFGAQHCFASKKAGGTARNKRKRTKPKDRGIHVFEGQFVQKNQILVKQHRDFTVYPGENVGSNPDKTLYALDEGHVRLSAEDLRPFPNSPLYPGVQSGLRIRKQFIHVFPRPQIGAFRLIREV